MTPTAYRRALVGLATAWECKWPAMLAEAVAACATSDPWPTVTPETDRAANRITRDTCEVCE